MSREKGHDQVLPSFTHPKGRMRKAVPRKVTPVKPPKPEVPRVKPGPACGHTADGGYWLRLVGIEPMGRNALRRAHWSAHSREKNRILTALLAVLPVAAQRPKIRAPVQVEYLRTYYNHPMDLDNLASTAKYVIDGLAAMGLIEGDGPDQCKPVYSQTRRRGNVPQVVVRITPLERE